MLVSTNWLKEWIDFGLDVQELSKRLTMAGLEVVSISPVDPCGEEIVVGQVQEVKPHPRRDNLKICLVNVNQSSLLQIVCGAPNAVAGRKYPIALIGSTIGDQEIQKLLIHGELSSGVLCSESEIGLGETSDQLMELDSIAPVGSPIDDYLGLPDYVLDIELTPNRADCLSIGGVANEVAILTGSESKPSPIPSIPATTSNQIPVEVETFEDCPAYCGRLIENIRADAKTPDWMQEKLRRVGLRSIHPVVDITNYVMMELGQPMHAFDTEIFNSSAIIVRRSRNGEKLTLLDGEVLELGEGVLLIADRDGPIGLAGVMGGESSGIKPETQNIFLEAAFFSPQAIRRSVSKFGKHTDASHRFERGVNPYGQARAIERATDLIQEITGGVPGPLQEIRDNAWLPKRKSCVVRESRIARVLGLTIPHDRISSILSAVNKEVTAVEGGWNVLPHDYRFDLEEEHDQIEEVARIYGYDKIPSSISFSSDDFFRGISESTIKESTVRNSLHSQGYYEAITYSFVDPKLQGKLNPKSYAKPLANPLAENLSVMRTSLWPGLISAFLVNYRRNHERVRLYEVGRVFLPKEEVNMLSGLSYGMFAPRQWGMEERQIDFFDVKGDLMKLFDLTGKADQVEFVVEQHDGLHPGCSAVIYLDQNKCGVVGQIHPEVLAEFRVEESVFAFEIEFEVFTERNLNQYSSISRYPPIVRDISILVNSELPVSEISNAIKDSAGEILENLTLFDVYSGVGIDLKTKSIAYRLTYRLHTRTLTDVEVDSSLAYILNILGKQFDAQLRA